MADWTRLGRFVVSRRVELGYRTRQDFATAAPMSARVLGDIETGRRSNFDSVTIARLEQGLRWRQGSVDSIVNGGGPIHFGRGGSPPLNIDEGDARHEARTPPEASSRDSLLIEIMRRTDVTDEQKVRIVEILIAEAETQRRAAERRLRERAEQMLQAATGSSVRLDSGDVPSRQD